MDQERQVLGRVVAFLAAKGENVTVLRRPDREVRNERAVDFELEVDGQLVGVEVTSASAHMADFVEADRFETSVEERVSRFVEQRDLGEIGIRFSYLRGVRKREVPRLVEYVATAIEGRLSQNYLPARIPATPPLDQVDVFKLGDARNSVGRVSSPIPGYFVEEKVLTFVDDLIEKKKTQGVAYSDLWILIHEGTSLFSAHDLATGLRGSRGKLPDNWSRIFFLSAADVDEVFSAS